VLSDLVARADIRGHRIDIGWTWKGADRAPPLRLVRRRRAYPEGTEDGLVVLDTGEPFPRPNPPRTRIERSLYLVSNSLAEGGLLQAEVRLLYVYDRDAKPGTLTGVVVSYYDPKDNESTVLVFDKVPRVTRQQYTDSAGTQREILNIFTSVFGDSPRYPRKRLGGAPSPVGQVDTPLHPDGEGKSNVFRWIEPGEKPVSVPFDWAETEQVDTLPLAAPAGRMKREIRVRRAGELIGDALLEDAVTADPATGDWEHRAIVQDRGLEAEQVYYYALFEGEGGSGSFLPRPIAKVSAMATGRYGLGDRLYDLLPGIHRHYDEPDQALRGKGQLAASSRSSVRRWTRYEVGRRGCVIGTTCTR
jgi:hypothetical protein